MSTYLEFTENQYISIFGIVNEQSTAKVSTPGSPTRHFIMITVLRKYTP